MTSLGSAHQTSTVRLVTYLSLQERELNSSHIGQHYNMPPNLGWQYPVPVTFLNELTRTLFYDSGVTLNFVARLPKARTMPHC